MTNNHQKNDKEIRVLEIRNYLLEPNALQEFGTYFNSHFVDPMAKLGGYTVGQFKIGNENNRFVWFRGFTDMKSRVKFLNDFYIDSEIWKEFGEGANNMMINSDNVFLLKPLSKSVTKDFLANEEGVTVVNFYYCNSTLDKVVALFDTLYIPFLESLKINTTMWVSEMQENDFPRLPVFQDKNLLVTITSYKDKKEFEAQQKRINEMDSELNKAMQRLITMQSNLVLFTYQNY